MDVYGESVTPDHLPADMAFFFELYQDCFQHHIQSRLQSTGDTLTAIVDESRKRKVQQDELTAYFLKQIYKPKNISYSKNSSAIDQKKHERTFEQMLEDITGNPIDNDFPRKTNRVGTNRVNFLIGDVGIGKSLLATKLIAAIDAKNQSTQSTYFVLPVYLDFELIQKNEHDSFKDVDDSFIEEIISTIRHLLEKDERWKIQYEEGLPSDPIQRFVRLNARLLRDRIRIFLIFDNTDRYHFYYTKYSFFETYRKEQAAKVKKNFTKIFSLFSRVEYLGDQGLAVLFVCRRSVLKYWVASGRPEDNHKSLIKDYGVYQITKVDELDAINSRFELADAAIEVIEANQPKKSLDYAEHLNNIRAALEASLTHRGANSLNRIRELTHHGTRSFIDFLGSLTIDFRTQYELVERLFHEQPHNLLRLYITNLKKRFAQFGDHFPNLFLVDAVVAPVDEFRDVHLGHRHTYWLKYLLLKHIVARREAGEIATYNELRERFVDACGYEPHLFDLVLGSLNAVNSFRCIELDEDSVGLGDCLRVRPTPRGIALLAVSEGFEPHVEFCFDFNYLQFVVDDPQLSFPVPWARKVFGDVDIGYMMSAAPAYRSGLGKYLAVKAEAVLYFLHILKHSARHELNTRLCHDGDLVRLLPNFDQIFANLFGTYRVILVNHVLRGEETMTNLAQRHKELSEDASFSKFFDGYASHNSPVEPS